MVLQVGAFKLTGLLETHVRKMRKTQGFQMPEYIRSLIRRDMVGE